MNPSDAKCSPFQCAPVPEIHFGSAASQQVGEVASRYGNRLLLITADRSFDLLERRFQLLAAIRRSTLELVDHFRISGEPSPADIDEIVEASSNSGVEVVVGIGGGSDPVEHALEARSEGLTGWDKTLRIPCLGDFGVTREDVPEIIILSDQKDNPVQLSEEGVAGIVGLDGSYIRACNNL